MSVAAVILAAGTGSRFKGDDHDAPPGAKLLALVKGQPVLTWAILPALAAGLDEVAVVGGACDVSAIVPDSVTLLQNDGWPLGLATSLKVGLDWCAAQGHERAVIGLGDMPGLAPAAWRAIATEPGGPIVFATYQGKRGHPVRLDATVWSMLPSSGDDGARSLARQHPELVREVACVGAPDDIDTIEDLQRWS